MVGQMDANTRHWDDNIDVVVKDANGGILGTVSGVKIDDDYHVRVNITEKLSLPADTVVGSFQLVMHSITNHNGVGLMEIRAANINGPLQTEEDTAVTIFTDSLLRNDSDGDGDALTIESVQAASHGSVSLSNGKIVFTPELNYNGPASFTYTVNDGKGHKDTATVTLKVTPVSDGTISAITDTDTDANTIMVGSAIGTGIELTAKATDADPEDDAAIRYSLANSVNGLFSIDASTGVVSLASTTELAKYNSNDVVEIEVKATSSDTSESTKKFNITILADTDGDGVLDHFDLDDDNDGILDVVEDGSGAGD